MKAKALYILKIVTGPFLQLPKSPEHCHRKKCFFMVQLISLNTVYYLTCVVFLNAKNAKKEFFL